ncbi:hypothetical protein M8E35_02225 [Desulfosporosinus nitroreducens]|nr:hypothetical protein [Desulfosporosinus nitroreducens]
MPLTKKYCSGPQNAAILLTERDYIPKDTLDVIRKLHVNDITIIGGTGVISLSVENQLNALGINTNRLSGLDKYETNIIIANQLDNVSEIAIVTGEDFSYQDLGLSSRTWA